MAEITKQALKVQNNQEFPNNNNGAITPSNLRGFNLNMIDSLVDEIGYNADSASWNQQIDALESFTSSTAVSITNLNASSASQQVSINNLNAFTASATGLNTGSLLVTASVVDDDITFTKGDGSQFTIQVGTGSFALSASFAATASEARNVTIIARNGNPNTLAAGTVVHITSAVGDNPIFNTASFTSEALSSNTLGILRYSSPTGADVEVVVNGIVTGVNTDPVLGYAAGDVIYLSSSGQFTKVQPQAPQQIVTLGQVLRAQQNQGSIYVNISNGWELEELHNVQITNPQTGDLIQYESASYGLWKNKSVSGAGITTTSSFNAYTSSTNQRVDSLEANSASVNISISNLNAATSSYVTETESGSFLITASFDNGTRDLTFTKGNNTTFAVNIPDVSGSAGNFVTTSSFNAYTSSNDARVSSLEANSASVNISISNLNSTTQSLNTSITNLNASSASQQISIDALNTNSGSVNTSITNINSATASLFTSASLALVTASVSGTTLTFTKGDASTFNVTLPTGSGGTIDTGSFATTGSNTFNGNQTVNGNISGSSLQIASQVNLGSTAYLRFESGSGGSDYYNIQLVPGDGDMAFSRNGASNVKVLTLAGSPGKKTVFQNNEVEFSSNVPQVTINTNVALGGAIITNTVITGSLLVSSSAATDLTVVGTMVITGSSAAIRNTISTDSVRIQSGSNGLSLMSAGNLVCSNFDGTQFQQIALENNEGTIQLSVDANGSYIADYDANTGDYSNAIKFQPYSDYQRGQVTILRDLDISGSVSITGSLTASLQQGYVWVGNASGRTTTVATSSFGSAIDTGSFATTGSNSFNGNQTITGSLTISSSAAVDLTVVGAMQLTGSTSGVRTRLNSTALEFFNPNRDFVTSVTDGQIYVTNPTVSELIIGVFDEPNFVNDVELNIRITSGSGIEFKDWDNGDFSYETWLSIAPNVSSNPNVVFKRSVDISGSLDISGNLTSSLQQGYVWVGNASGRTTTVATSSFGGGGGAAFPYTGSAQITGSLGVTGSINGFVNTLSISSNTASLDFNNGNFFTLQLVSGSITHLTATNIKAGQTINLLVKTDSGSAAASGSLTFSPTFKFAGGFDYTPTAITASQDLVSFVTFDTTQILASQVKNLS